jgi:putative endonuclease
MGTGASYTRQNGPVELVYSEARDSAQSAIRRERQIKKWSRAKKEALITGDMEQLHTLAKRRMDQKY